MAAAQRALRQARRTGDKQLIAQAQAQLDAAIRARSVHRDQSAAAGVDALTGPERNAYRAAVGILESWGLGSLAKTVLGYVKEGYDQAAINYLITETPEYKRRFAANETRRKHGLPVLSPAEYISTERAYRQVLTAAGLPKGFYDQTSDFTDWIAKDISASEISGRVDLAQKAMYERGDAWRQQFRDYYPNLSDGDLTAIFLDEKRALPVLDRMTRMADVGLAAKNADVNIGQTAVRGLVDSCVTGEQAQAGFQTVATLEDTYARLADIYGISYGTADATAEVFNQSGQQSAQKRRKRLASAERGTFGGSSGIGAGSLSQRTQS